jgi:hypothetical protein
LKYDGKYVSHSLNVSWCEDQMVEMATEASKQPKGTQGKRENFRRLAENRTNNALVAIGRIGNLSNRQLYEFEDAEVRKVIKALKDAVSEVESRFASPRGKADARFKL